MGSVKISLSAFIGMLLSALAVTIGRSSEPTWDFAVQVSAVAEASPARVTLTWPQDSQTTPNSYVIYRKGPYDSSWGSIASLPGTATSYVDSGLSVGTANFGKITSASDPRVAQFALKYVF